MWFFLKGFPQSPEFVNWKLESGPGPENSLHEDEGLAVCLYMQNPGGSQKIAIGLAGKTIDKSGTTWIQATNSVWKVDLQELAKLWPGIQRLSWLQDSVDIVPEFVANPTHAFSTVANLSTVLLLITEADCKAGLSQKKINVEAAGAARDRQRVNGNEDIQLIRCIDDGNFGEVWEARQKSLNRTVAVKIIKASMTAIASAIQHAQALALCQHRNVITVHLVTKVKVPETGKIVDGVVMEFLHGLRLDTRLRTPPVLLESEAIHFVNDMISGLQHIHGRGIPHGDLSTKNIMITDAGIKLIDIDYSNSESTQRLSSTSTQDLQNTDLCDLRSAIRRVVQYSRFDADFAEDLRDAIAVATTIEELKAILDDKFERIQKHNEVSSSSVTAEVEPDPKGSASRSLLDQYGISEDDSIVLRITGQLLSASKHNTSMISASEVGEQANQEGLSSDRVHDAIEMLQQMGLTSGQGRFSGFLQFTTRGMQAYLTLFDPDYRRNIQRICTAIVADNERDDISIASRLSLQRPLVLHVLDWLEQQGHCTVSRWNTGTNIRAVSPSLRRMLEAEG